MRTLRYIPLALLITGIALASSGCWHVMALQGAMAAAQIAGAETEEDPTKEYREDQNEYIQEYFKKDRYNQVPNDPALAKVPHPTAGDMAASADTDPLLETAPMPKPGTAKPVQHRAEKDATSLAEEFKSAP